MGSFTKKSNTYNNRARITRRKRRSSRTKRMSSRTKRRSSRTKYKRSRYKKRGGEGPTNTMSKTIVKSFPIMEHFPSCGTCMTAIDNNVLNKSKPEKELHHIIDSQEDDSWDGWTSAEINELGVPNNITSKLSPSMDSSKIKPSVKKTKNPYARNR